MIPIVLVAIGAVVTAAGIATGRIIRKRILRRRADEAAAISRRALRDPGAPLELGDVVVLDSGRGTELWLARRLDLAEAEGDPFLVLFEAEGPTASRAIVALDPVRPTQIAVLQPQQLAENEVPGRSANARPPGTIEVQIDGGLVRLQLEQRRTARGVVQVVSEVSSGSKLPHAGDSLFVATYGGGAGGRAVIVRGGDLVVHSYVGTCIDLAEVSVLCDRPGPLSR